MLDIFWCDQNDVFPPNKRYGTCLNQSSYQNELGWWFQRVLRHFNPLSLVEVVCK